MKKIIAIVSCVIMYTGSNACPLCNTQVHDAIYNSRFYPNLLTMLSAFIATAIIVIILTAVSTSEYNAKRAADAGVKLLSPVPLTSASLVIGIGMGGFLDGIVLHQILQVHEMLSNKIPPKDYVSKSVNMFWDGIFHAFCLIVVLTGIILLWKLLKRNDISRSGNLLAGGLIGGWGLFNVVEGVIDHQILQLHNVVEISANHAIANYSFLGASVLMLVAGFVLIKRNAQH